MKLSYYRLTLLKDLAALGSIAAVAKAQSVTRTAISQQLTLLEEEVGEPLFERHHRGVDLNQLGRYLVSRVEPLVSTMTEIETELDAMHDEISGTFKLAAFASIAHGLLPTVMARLRDDHPRLEIQFQEVEPEEGLRGLKSKQFDMALIDDLSGDPELISVVDLFHLTEDRMVALVGQEHALSQSMLEKIHLAQLQQYMWVLNVGADAYQSFVRLACHKAGFSPKVHCSCRNMSLAVDFVRRGTYVAVLPKLALQIVGDLTGITVLEIEPPISRKIYCAVPRGSAGRPVVRRILSDLRQLCRERTLD